MFKVTDYTSRLLGWWKNPSSKEEEGFFFIKRGDGKVLNKYDIYRIEYVFELKAKSLVFKRSQ